MLDDLLAGVFLSQWIVAAIVSALLLAVTEIGFVFGRRLHRAGDDGRKGQIGGIQGAILGLLALLLGFTFAMSVGRYETRRDLVLQEANSIGTTFLRASFLPDQHRQAVEELLRKYVDARLRFYDVGADKSGIGNAEQTTAAIQRDLWAHTVAASKSAPTPLTVAFVSSLNETIDLDAKRLAATRNHVPGAVWMLLVVVASCGCCATGYAAGCSGKRTGFGNLLLPLLIAVVIFIIADLDRPRAGLIRINQQPLVDLRTSLKETTR
jgi:hypothetical protein